MWKAFYWCSATLIAGVVSADAYLWIGPDAGARFISAAVCGFVAAFMWLLVGASLYELASR